MIFADPHLSKDRLNAYYDQVQQQQQEKQRISKLTEQLMSKARLKFKYLDQLIRLQNKDQKREEQFNKKLEQLKKLSTFVDVRAQISKLNLLNDRKLLMKLQVIEKTSKYYQGFKQKQDTQFDEIKFEGNEHQKIKDLHVPKRPQTQTMIEELYAPYEDLLNFDTTPRGDTNLFYQKMFQTKRSPEKNKELQIFEEEAYRMKAFLEKQGLLEGKSQSQHHNKRVALRKAPIEDYYRNFQKKCENIVKACKFESRKRSDVTDSKQILQKPRKTVTQAQSACPFTADMSARKQRSQTNVSLSPVQHGDRNLCQSGARIYRVRSVCESDAPSPLKQKFQKQFETLSQAMSETQNTFKKLNQENKQLFHKMSTTMNTFKKQLNQYNTDDQ